MVRPVPLASPIKGAFVGLWPLLKYGNCGVNVFSVKQSWPRGMAGWGGEA